MAVDALTRAGKELDEALAAAAPPPSETPDRSAGVESLRIQLERLRRLRQGLSSLDAQGKYLPRSAVLELLVGILFADRTVLRIAAEIRTPGEIRFLPSGEIGEIVRRIEEETLDGIEVDRLVEQMSAVFDTLQNLGHPMERYRRLVRLEKSQEEIHHLRDRIREQREATLAAITSGKDAEAPVHLRDVGLFLTELDVFRSAAAETREFTKQHFRILREKRRGDEEEESADRAVLETIVYVDARMAELLPIVRGFEETERVEAWKRRIPGLKSMRSLVERQLADTLVRQAREMRMGPGEADPETSLPVIERAVSLLSGGRLAPEDLPEVAVRIGSLLVEGKGGWEPFPGRVADEKEREMIARILPHLPREGVAGARREEGFYLAALLRMATKDPGAGRAAREYLEKYPASPLSGGIGVRIGHEALLAGDTAGAVARYRAAADSGSPGATTVARYMLAWIGFHSGNVDGALGELSPLLTGPSFPCGNPSTFEGDMIALAVRAWKESPTDRLDNYPPVKEGTCGGKVLLSALWEAEEKRGESARSAAVRDIATRRFPSDDAAAALEMQTVEALLSAGREGEAISRALALPSKYGPDSAWAQSRSAPVIEKSAREMAGMLKGLAERKFNEAVRSGDGAAHVSAAALIEEYLGTRGDAASAADAELRLKWAIALLGSGDREGGILLLEELVGEQRGDATGERAAVLYAETMVAGYERGESAAEEAEDAALLLLEERPSEKAVSLSLRASSAFLAGKEYGRARSAAEEAEGSRSATPSQATQARLIQAEAAVFEEDLSAARGKADLVLSGATAGDDSGSTTRAKDLFLLSSLKEIDGKVVSGDVKGAALALEDLAAKFPRAQELPMYLLRSMRLYAKGEDAEGAIRTGLLFLRDFPRREEAPEVAGVIGPLLEDREEFARAGDLYEGVAEGFPKSAASSRFLFHAARIAESHGPPEAASRRFSSYRARYPSPAGMWTYASLFLGLDGWRRGDPKKSIRLMEEGLRKLEAGVEENSPEDLAELAGKVRIAIGENWADQFRKTRLVVPLEKSLAFKEKLFRRALGEFEKAGKEAPLEVALHADLLSGDLFVEYGKAILDSQRPKGLKGSDREEYEEALRKRARSYIERSVDWYAGALERLEEEEGPSDLAVPIRNRLETAQLLLEGAGTAEAKAKEGVATEGTVQ